MYIDCMDMLFQAREHLGTPGNHRSLGKNVYSLTGRRVAARGPSNYSK